MLLYRQGAAGAAEGFRVQLMIAENQLPVDKYLFNAEGAALIRNAVPEGGLVKDGQIGIMKRSAMAPVIFRTVAGSVSPVPRSASRRNFG